MKPKIAPNWFGISFRTCRFRGGLDSGFANPGRHRPISRVLLLAAAPIWDALLVTYFSKGWKGAQKDWSDPVLSPFLALVLIVPTLLAGELCPVNLGVGRILVTRDGNDTTA